MFRQTCTAALVALAALGSFTLATAQEPKAAVRREADHQLHRHEADAHPGGRVQDGQRRVGGGNGCLLQEELRRGFSDGRFLQGRAPAAPGANHQTVLSGHVPCHAGPVSPVRQGFGVQDGRGEGRSACRGPGDGTPRRKTFGFNKDYSWRNAGFEQTDEHPVVNVSWNDAVAFCKWLSGRKARPTGCRPRPSGNTPAAPERRRGTTAATIPRRWPRWRTWPTRRSRRSSRTVEIPSDQSQRRLRVHSAGGPIQAQRLRTLRHARQCLAVVRGLVWRRLLRQIARRRPNGPRQRRYPCPSGRFLARLSGRTPPVPPVASGTHRSAGSTAQASALPGLCDRHWRFFDAYTHSTPSAHYWCLLG